MFTYECLVVLSLFASPVGACPPAWAEACRSSAIALAVDAEFLDSRATKFEGESPQRIWEYLHEKRRHFVSYPVLEECCRFPSRQVINDYIAANRAYSKELIARRQLDPIHYEELGVAIYETDQLYHVWDLLRDGCCDYYYATVRRTALQALKETIGAEAFYSGVMPPHLPVWRIPEARR